MTTNPPSVDVKKILVDGGVLTPIYVGEEPVNPDEVVTIYDTGGDNPNPKWVIDFPDIQIRSRANDYSTSYSNLLIIRDKILGMDKSTVNTTDYVGIFATSDILSLERDSHDRYICVCNFRINREIASSENRQNF